MMRYLVGAIFVAICCVGTAEAREPCDRPAETVVALSASAAVTESQSGLGRSAFACGRYFSAANLMERTVGRRPSALQRFNLAATYARTGRLAEAKDLYATIVADGQFTRATDDISYLEGDRPIGGFNLADEARRRLAAIEYMTALYARRSISTVANASPAVRTAEEAGTNAAEIAVAPDVQAVNAFASFGTPVIDDRRALELDGLLGPN